MLTKTCLFNFDPLLPQFYIVKLGFTGINIIFLIFDKKKKNIDCGYPLELPRLLSRNMKMSEFFYLKIFSFWR